MGKIFRLSERPSFFEETIQLIERSFHYHPPYKFQIDFAPLVDISNHQHSFIMLNESEKVIAHIALNKRHLLLEGKEFNLGLIGGVAVDEESRGLGHFKDLLDHVIGLFHDELCFFLLWSDKKNFYQKFFFELCGIQYEQKQILNDQTHDLSRFHKTKYFEISSSEKRQIQELYNNSFAKIFTTINRTSEDWRLIEKITSTDLFLKKEDSLITTYFFQNKGQDLQNIIFEYGSLNSHPFTLKELAPFGTIWSGKEIGENQTLQYQFLLRPGNTQLFSQFIFKFTKSRILVREINFSSKEIFFDFNNELMALNFSEFLQGTFGPGVFEELDVPDLFISGLDSV